jgi:hypothetical protein
VEALELGELWDKYGLVSDIVKAQRGLGARLC